MPTMNQSIINFALYEDGGEFLGIAKVSVPDLKFLTQTASGAGIAGNLEHPVIGHLDAMTLGITFNSLTASASSLAEPRPHTVMMRIAEQSEDTAKAVLGVTSIKHTFVILPKSVKGGTIAPASGSDASGEYACHYWKEIIDGVTTKELDPVNYKCEINGVDYLADVRKALGK